jgi:hypothetical protein
VRKLLAFPLHPPNRKALHAVSRLCIYIRFALIIFLDFCSDLQPEDPVYLSNQDQSYFDWKAR